MESYFTKKIIIFNLILSVLIFLLITYAMFFEALTYSREVHLKIAIFQTVILVSVIINFIYLFKQVSMEKKKLMNEVHDTYVSTLKALAETVDAKDSYTGAHSDNVSRYVEIICDRLKISEKQKNDIIIGAGMHDIGKVGIEDSILKKPERLTNDEYDKMKQHAHIGASIMKNLKGFENISSIIEHHHERWDGKGYPHGLKEKDIPLGSQVIAIADTFDAITSNRVYRKSLGKDVAVKILLEERGQQFNPELVDVFIEEINNNRYELKTNENNKMLA